MLLYKLSQLYCKYSLFIDLNFDWLLDVIFNRKQKAFSKNQRHIDIFGYEVITNKLQFFDTSRNKMNVKGDYVNNLNNCSEKLDKIHL